MNAVTTLVAPRVSIIMGSQSDWTTMRRATEVLDALKIPYECKVVSAHRTPARLVAFSEQAKAKGVQVIIAGAGGAAHLPGMVAAMTLVPVVAVPVQSKALNGMDSLLSIAQMPAGVAVATQAIGSAGAYNAGLLAAQILAATDDGLYQRLAEFREAEFSAVAEEVELCE